MNENQLNNFLNSNRFSSLNEVGKIMLKRI